MTRDLNVLIDTGAEVITVDGELHRTTAEGELWATVLPLIVRFELRRKDERQSRANAQCAADGGMPEGVSLTDYVTVGSVLEDDADVVGTLLRRLAAEGTLHSLLREYDRAPVELSVGVLAGRVTWIEDTVPQRCPRLVGTGNHERRSRRVACVP